MLAYVFVTLPDVRALATENPTETAFMRLRKAEAAAEGRALRHAHRWVPYSRISPNLRRAVLVAEDDAFFQHEGVDFTQLRDAIREDLLRGQAVRGASTITQQLAKNLYLSPSRDPLRKLREWILARRLEAALPKTRILEIYLNVIEWGDGVWGAEAAARTHLGVSAASLTPAQAALLAGAIVNPRVLSPSRPNARLRRRQQIILSRMRGAELPAQAARTQDALRQDEEPPAVPVVQEAVPVPEPVEAVDQAPVPDPAEPDSADTNAEAGREPPPPLQTQ